jgi:hypothetical protein
MALLHIHPRGSRGRYKISEYADELRLDWVAATKPNHSRVLFSPLSSEGPPKIEYNLQLNSYSASSHVTL